MTSRADLERADDRALLAAMTEHSNMRTSDADRAEIAEQLRRAILEGRMLADEFDERLEHTLREPVRRNVIRRAASGQAGQSSRAASSAAERSISRLRSTSS